MCVCVCVCVYISIYIYVHAHAQRHTGWNDKIVALEKTTWFHFRLMKTSFLFCCRPSTSWPVVYKSQEPSIMSESNTMFNERDQRCTAVQLMLSTDPSYDNRTIARTIAGLPQIIGTCPGWWKQSFQLRLWSLVWFQARATSCHLTSLKLAWKSTPKCTWMCWRVWWSPGAIRWPMADPGCGSRTRCGPTSPKRPRLGFRRSATTLYPSLTGPPPPPTWTRWTTSFGHTSRISPTWPPTPKPAWSPPSAEYLLSSCRRLWKRHAPSPGSISRQWLRLKAATLMSALQHKLPELIFSIKVLK